MKRSTLALIIIGILIIAFPKNTKAQTQPQQKNITITLTLTGWQLVLKGVAKLPLEESGDLYAYIVSECNRQLSPPVKKDTIPSTPKQPVKKN